MKNVFSVFALFVVIAFAVSSCGEDEDDNKATALFKTSVDYSNGNPPVKQAGVIVWLYNDGLTLIGKQTTPTNGEVKFTDLVPGLYEYEAGFDADGDNDVDFSTPNADGDFTLSEGEDKVVTAECN